ncbi:hypothetical protein Mgra_00009989 [Meloidogyne graminicola]|uniref:Uncharacterized protein n=1 Tax=Meloidogyne graminicola TaxID=189291 RepID=A0A8S9ZAU7_9BILA|nr:hypothetical protein Mgra_00009989 [Meloidogyne graminicola]
MGLMPIKAFLFIFVIFGFTKCSIDDGMFTFEEVHVIENEINTPILPLIEKKSTECFGILFCYISQLSLLNNKGNWKPKQSYDLTKKGESKLCENAAKLGHTNYEDQTWHGMIVLKKGENNFEIHADIFPKGETLPLKGITLSQLDSFIFGKDDSLKDKILEISQIDKEYMNPDSGLKPLLDDYPGLFALKYDMLAKRPENMQTKPLNRVFLWSYVDKCLVHRPNFISNRIELFASLRNLASCNRTQEKKSGLKYYETCKYKNGDENIMTESNSMNITLFKK